MKRKKNTNIVNKDTLTKYYKATYTNGDEEVFISDTMDTAREYATGTNARGRQLIQLEEFKQFIDSLL